MQIILKIRPLWRLASVRAAPLLLNAITNYHFLNYQLSISSILHKFLTPLRQRHRRRMVACLADNSLSAVSNQVGHD